MIKNDGRLADQLHDLLNIPPDYEVDEIHAPDGMTCYIIYIAPRDGVIIEQGVRNDWKNHESSKA